MTFIYILIYFGSIFVFSNTLYRSLEFYFVDQKTTELRRYASYIAGDISATGAMYNIQKGTLKEDLDRSAEMYNVRLISVNYQGTVVWDTVRALEGKQLSSVEIVTALKDGAEAIKKDKGKRLVNIFYPMVSSDTNKVTGVVVLTSNLQSVYTMIGTIQNIIFNLLIIIGVIVAVLYIYLTGIFVKPLKQLLKAIKNISKGHLDEKVEIQTNDEFAELGNAFNNMTDRLYDIDQSRSEFVSNVSHELKTPLSSIKVLTESLLIQDGLPAELYREFLGDINSEIDRQTAIVNDLLTLVRLDEREKVLNITKVSLNDLIEQILKRLQPLAEQKEIELIMESNCQVDIKLDEMKITLALSNLVENGIKYNKENGKVIVTIDANHDQAFVTVTDTGIGIPNEHFAKLFERFYRVDKTRDRATGGTGLGLSIAHRAILLHKGSIQVDSEIDAGTKFYVALPLRQNMKNI